MLSVTFLSSEHYNNCSFSKFSSLFPNGFTFIWAIILFHQQLWNLFNMRFFCMKHVSLAHDMHILSRIYLITICLINWFSIIIYYCSRRPCHPGYGDYIWINRLESIVEKIHRLFESIVASFCINPLLLSRAVNSLFAITSFVFNFFLWEFPEESAIVYCIFVNLMAHHFLVGTIPSIFLRTIIILLDNPSSACSSSLISLFCWQLPVFWLLIAHNCSSPIALPFIVCGALLAAS